MPEDRNNIKSDLITIAKLNKQIDFNNVDSIRKLMLVLNKKEYFKSSLKTKYISILDKLCKSDDYTPECIVCKKTYGGRKPLCPDCEKTIITKSLSQSENYAAQKVVNDKKNEKCNKQTFNEQKNIKDNKEQSIERNAGGDNKKRIGILAGILFFVVAIIKVIGLWKTLGVGILGLSIYQGILYFKSEDKTKRQVLKVLIPLICAIMLFSIGKVNRSMDMIDLMGADEEVVYKYYDKDLFKSRINNVVYNVEGEPLISIKNSTGKVDLIYVGENVKSNVSVCGIHIGDSREKAFKVLEDDRYILVDSSVDPSGVLNDVYTYIMKGNPYKLMVTFDGQNVWCLTLMSN